MDKAQTYEDWKHYADQYDNLEDNQAWKHKINTKDYDFEFI